MIKEVTIEPEVLLEWSKDRGKSKEFLNSYGLGTRRVLSSFPKRQPNKLISYLMKKIDSLDNDNHKLRYEGMLDLLRENLYLRESTVNSNDSWALLVENESVPFDTVITRQKLNCDNILTLEDISESDFLYLDHQVSFKRTKEDLIHTISSFLKLTMSEILIIDAYAWKPNAIQTIKAIIKEVSDRKFKSKPVEITVIYKELAHGSPAPDAKFLKQEIEKEFEYFPDGIKLIVKQLKETEDSDTFHNRYILNDIGGISLGHGLDISDKEHTTDEVTLLTKSNYRKRWLQFARDTNFKVVSLA